MAKAIRNVWIVIESRGGDCCLTVHQNRRDFVVCRYVPLVGNSSISMKVPYMEHVNHESGRSPWVIIFVPYRQ